MLPECQRHGSGEPGFALLSWETGRQRRCWEQSTERGRAKAARQTQTMLSQKAKLLSCPDGQTETSRLWSRDNRASSGKGKDVAGGSAACPVLFPLGKQRGVAAGAGVHSGCPAWQNSAGGWDVCRSECRPWGDGCSSSLSLQLAVQPQASHLSCLRDVFLQQPARSSFPEFLGVFPRYSCARANRSRAHFKLGNPSDPELHPSGVLKSRDTQGRPRPLANSPVFAPISKAVFGLVSRFSAWEFSPWSRLVQEVLLMIQQVMLLFLSHSPGGLGGGR